MVDKKSYNTIIIGGGPIGLACAIELQKMGIDYLIIEKGCLVNSIYHYPANMSFFSTSERLEIGDIPFVSNSQRPTRNEALEYYRRVTTHFQLRIHLFEEAIDIIKNQTDFSIYTPKADYTTSNIVIATGFYDLPFLLHVPGEDLTKVTHYYNDPHRYALRKVIVIGAQNSAVDAALEIWRKGAQVTMIVRDSGIGERVKYWIRPDLMNRIEEGSITVFYNSEIKSIRDTEVDIDTPNGILTLENDEVIAATGYQPNLAFLEKIGVKLSDDETKTPKLNDATHETNIPGIYLAGVICGGMNTHKLFIENSRSHAQKIATDIARISK